MQDLRIVIPFMRYRHPGMIFSVAMMVLSVIVMGVKGFNFGLDFSGGTQLELRYEVPPNLDTIRATLENEGFVNNEVVQLGTDRNILVRVQNEVADDSEAMEESGETALRVTEILSNAAQGGAELVSSTFVSSQVGDELKEQGGLGMLVATIMLMIYIAMRFQFKFAVGAVFSIVHDVIVTLGFISLLEVDVDLNVLASVLAMIGYSVNDTVVVADRIRENFRIMRGTTPEEIIDTAVSQTFVRTLITSITTLLVLFALLFFGGQTLYGFSLVMIIGILVGTYSSIYIASSTLLYMNLSQEDMTPPEQRDKAELDAIP